MGEKTEKKGSSAEKRVDGRKGATVKMPGSLSLKKGSPSD